MRVRAARGAIRVSEDTAETVLTSTTRLLEAILQRNEIEHDDLVSAFFTVTDLRSAFPAEAARRMGLGRLPLLCAQEIPVEGSMTGVVRVLVHFHTSARPRTSRTCTWMARSRCAMTSADRVAVVGTGLIGTSVAMAAGRVGDACGGSTPTPTRWPVPPNGAG